MMAVVAESSATRPELKTPMALQIAGGVAIILFGVRFLRKGMDRLFGPRLGVWLKAAARRRGMAFLTGIGISILMPSSTTVSALAVQTVESGLLTPRQMLAVLLGADIGLTVLVLLSSVGIEHYAVIPICLGVFLFQFMKADRVRGVGQAILSLGLILLGIGQIKVGAMGVDPTGDLAEFIRLAENHPVFLAMVAAVLALALQSSTATILLVLGLGEAGTTLPVAVAVVAGANVGIALTTLGLGWRSHQARRLSLGNLILKVTVAVIFLSLTAQVAQLLARLPVTEYGMRIAAAHTGFNVLVAMIGLPLIHPLSQLTKKMVALPANGGADAPFAPKYINLAIPDSPALALGQSQREILRCGEIAREMLDDLWRALRTDDEKLTAEVSKRDDQVDLLDTQIKQYLARLGGQDLDAVSLAEQLRQLRFLAEIETIGDVIDKNLSELAVKKIRARMNFSEEGWQELDSFYQKVRQNMLLAEAAFQTRDRGLAQQLLRHKNWLNTNYRELRDRHLARLNAGLDESFETSSVHLDLLTHLRRINSCVTHIAYAIVQDDAERGVLAGAGNGAGGVSSEATGSIKGVSSSPLAPSA